MATVVSLNFLQHDAAVNTEMTVNNILSHQWKTYPLIVDTTLESSVRINDQAMDNVLYLFIIAILCN